MNPGDLVKLDIPGQRAHGKIGMVVGKELKATYDWMRDHMGQPVKSFSYEVMVGTEVWRVGYNELLEEAEWDDETR